jgi:hypothetical protein
MRKTKKCRVQISLGLLLERQWEWMNNFSDVEVQEWDLFEEEEFDSEEEEFEEDEDFMAEDWGGLDMFLLRFLSGLLESELHTCILFMSAMWNAYCFQFV